MQARITQVIWAGDNAVFSEKAAQGMIGQRVPVNVRDDDDGPVLEQLGMGTIVQAELVESGRGVELTVVVEP